MSPIDAILAGDVGMNALFLAFIFAIAVVITIVGFVFVYWSTKKSEEKDSHSLAKYEKHWTVIIVAIFIVFSVATINYLPYPYAHPDVKPATVVDVQAQQFFWCLSPAPTWGGSNCQSNYQITAGETVLFNVTSVDVTHDFGVYKCSDSKCTNAALLGQVQVMPSFYNQIMITFSTAGIYYIRCLEFCGYGHYIMYTQLNVTSS